MNFGKPEQEFQRGRRNNPYECEPVDYRLFTYRQKIVDKRIISTYASSGDLPGRRGPKRAARLFSRKDAKKTNFYFKTFAAWRLGARKCLGFIDNILSMFLSKRLTLRKIMGATC
jgi:hypothetical protein